MRRIGLYLTLVAAMALGGTARADLGTIDPVPASTLLLPYFEVDLDDTIGNGANTLFTLQNVSASAAVAHVTLWTDLGVPTLRYDIYLTGYDAEEVNLHEVFVKGGMTHTADAGSDRFPTDDLISPQGPLSQDINFPGDTGPCVTRVRRDLTPFEVQQIQLAHTGQPAEYLGGQCAAQRPGDNVARGYVTIDSVTQCTLLAPSDPSYFTGIADGRNILAGQWRIENRSAGTAFGESMVSVESAPSAQPLPPGYTFYQRYVGASAVDNREPLATAWAARFRTGGASLETTDLLVWRDSGVGSSGPVNCSTRAPAWYPLPTTRVLAFDEEENGQEVIPPEAVPAFPALTNRIRVDGSALAVPFDSGWLLLDLNATVPGEQLPFTKQSYVVVVRRKGAAEVGLRGLPFDNASDPAPPNP